MALPTTAEIDAAVPSTGPKPRSDLTNAVLKNMLAEMNVARRDSVSPKDFGGDPTGAADSTGAVAAVIDTMNAEGIAGRFDGGSWRVTSGLPACYRPIIVGDGSGEIFVDYNATGGAAVMWCQPPTGETYTVTAVDLGATYDASTTFTADSSVTRLTLSLGGGQVMPAVGAIGKLSATNILVPNENSTDQVGIHVEILAVSGSFVYVPWIPIDPYSTGMQLIMLGTQPTSIEGLRFRGNFANILTQDQRYGFLTVEAAAFPLVRNLHFRDGTEAALVFSGCYMPSSRGIRVAHMRSALLSETPGIPGYGVVENGCFMSVHDDLAGHDVRHLFTTRTFGPAAPRVTWGRSFRATVVNSRAAGCSAAAFDTHPDAWEPSFIGCRATGGYFGEAGSPMAFQLRGSYGSIVGCRASGFIYGVQLMKFAAAELCGHTIQDFKYDGSGVAIRIMHDAGISGASARQTAYLGDIQIDTTVNTYGMIVTAADVVLNGTLRINMQNAAVAHHGIDCNEATTFRSAGGEYIFDCSRSTAGNPRPLVFVGDGNSIPNLDLKVISGTTPWQSVLSEGGSPAAANGPINITCDADKAPLTVGGGYSQNGGGASNLLQPAGAFKLIGTINGGRVQAPKTGAYALNAFDNRSKIPVTSTATITVPAAAILGPDFECLVIAQGATVTIDGPGGTNTSVASGTSCRIAVINNVIYTYLSVSNAVIS